LRLKQFPKAVGIYSCGRTYKEQPPFPGAENVIDPALKYSDTLQHHGMNKIHDSFSRKYFHGIVFDPDIYAHIIESMLSDYQRFSLFKNNSVRDIQQAGGVIKSVMLSSGCSMSADVYVDATGDGDFCLKCGCKALRGSDSRHQFNEPDAPEVADSFINAITLIYRVSPTTQTGLEPLPPDVPEACWWQKNFPFVVATQCPWGDYQLNMLPTMEFREMASLTRKEAYSECCRRVYAHWHFLQKVWPDFQHYHLSWIAPALGIRESNRIVCEYMLTENDVISGITAQSYNDHIALADHGLDRHGGGGGYRGLTMPYGISYRCLIPKGYKNLLIACRAAGFSSLAASSCRLARAMIQLGQAAGTAAALAIQKACPVADVPIECLQKMLRDQHVQLDWPMPPSLNEYLNKCDA
jgi:hypothetical protein